MGVFARWPRRGRDRSDGGWLTLRECACCSPALVCVTCRYLQKLLFVHGAWSYRRLSKVILYSFYKTLTLYLVSFYYSFDNGFSGQVPWDKLTNALWNVIFTFFPILFLGLFDQDVSAASLMKYPALYKSGQRNDFVRTASPTWRRRCRSRRF